MSPAIRLAVAAMCCGLLLVSCKSDEATSPMTIARDAGWNHFGESTQNAGEVIALGSIGGGEKNVIVEATIIEVCQVKGCWMRVTENGEELFVRFKDYGFFVPRDAAGRRVVMHGQAVAETASIEELRHYAEDAGKSPEEIAAITEPQTRVTFYADSVFIRQ